MPSSYGATAAVPGIGLGGSLVSKISRCMEGRGVRVSTVSRVARSTATSAMTPSTGRDFAQDCVSSGRLVGHHREDARNHPKGPAVGYDGIAGNYHEFGYGLG